MSAVLPQEQSFLEHLHAVVHDSVSLALVYGITVAWDKGTCVCVCVCMYVNMCTSMHCVYVYVFVCV
jgi:hypothetical protein